MARGGCSTRSGVARGGHDRARRRAAARRAPRSLTVLDERFLDVAKAAAMAKAAVRRSTPMRMRSAWSSSIEKGTMAVVEVCACFVSPISF